MCNILIINLLIFFFLAKQNTINNLQLTENVSKVVKNGTVKKTNKNKQIKKNINNKVKKTKAK